MKRLFKITTQPTFKMYKQLNKMNMQHSKSLIVLLVISCVFGLLGIYSIVRYILGDTSAMLIKGIFGVLVNTIFVIFYLKGHELLTEKSMKEMGKKAYLEIFSTFYDDKVTIQTDKTKGSVAYSYFNKLYEDNQYYYISYSKQNIQKSYIVVDKDGFTLGNKQDFKKFIIKIIEDNKKVKKSK